MKTLLYGLFDTLLSDPLNERICKWGLGIASSLFFGSMIINYLMLNL